MGIEKWNEKIMKNVQHAAETIQQELQQGQNT